MDITIISEKSARLSDLTLELLSLLPPDESDWADREYDLEYIINNLGQAREALDELLYDLITCADREIDNA